ncbi:hypothetical protein Zmor_007649 [Zophobas morio]|uniref:7tm 6 domain containing protein n=1 Tax=Zophobas morio TaxID=2755281 RepID=A0AA38IW45_9CUCU|nr:hypothetical protein Zmor_007649 [Zophobas morio]
MKAFSWKDTIKFNVLILKLVGLWPENNTYKLNLYILYSFLSINIFINAHTVFQTTNILFVYKDLEALTSIIFTTFMEVLTSAKAYFFIQNMDILKQLMNDLEEKMFQPKNQHQRELVQQILNVWRFTYVAFWIPVGTTLILWSVIPFLDGSFKNYGLPFTAWYPYNSKSSPWYQFTYIHQVISICFIASANLNMDMIIVALLVYIVAQCEILCDDLKNLIDYNNTQNFYFMFRDCINHHKKILRFADNSNKFIDKLVLGQFFTSGASLALAMFQLTLVFSVKFYRMGEMLILVR